MASPVTLGSQGSDGGDVTLASAQRLKFLTFVPALQGDTYVVPGNPPRTGQLQVLGRQPKFSVSGKQLIVSGDSTGTGGVMLPDSRLSKFKFTV